MLIVKFIDLLLQAVNQLLILQINMVELLLHQQDVLPVGCVRHLYLRPFNFDFVLMLQVVLPDLILQLLQVVLVYLLLIEIWGALLYLQNLRASCGLPRWLQFRGASCPFVSPLQFDDLSLEDIDLLLVALPLQLQLILHLQILLEVHALDLQAQIRDLLLHLHHLLPIIRAIAAVLLRDLVTTEAPPISSDLLDPGKRPTASASPAPASIGIARLIHRRTVALTHLLVDKGLHNFQRVEDPLLASQAGGRRGIGRGTEAEGSGRGSAGAS